jgi:hypothetical protein
LPAVFPRPPFPPFPPAALADILISYITRRKYGLIRNIPF